MLCFYIYNVATVVVIGVINLISVFCASAHSVVKKTSRLTDLLFFYLCSQKRGLFYGEVLQCGLSVSKKCLWGNLLKKFNKNKSTHKRIDINKSDCGLVRRQIQIFYCAFLRFTSVFINSISREVCPAIEVFSSARRIRYGSTSLTGA